MDERLASFGIIAFGACLVGIWLFFAIQHENKKPRPLLRSPPPPPPTSRNPSVIVAVYYVGVLFVGAFVFIGSWIYCIASYGFLFGVGLGWLPSIIVAVIAGLLWPALVLVVLFVLAQANR